MKVVVNCWALRNKQLDGIGYFTVNTISRIIKNHPEVTFLILCDTKFNENYFDFKNVRLIKIFPPYRHPFLYLFYMEIVVPLFLKKQKPDLFLSMDGFLSLSSSCVQIPVIYDINFEHYPQDLPFRNRIYFLNFFKRFAKKGKRIVTISNYSKLDIASFYKINENKIDNVSCGIDSKFIPLDEINKISIRNKWSEGKEYFFFIGSMHPRKNIKRLIEAFNLFKENTNSNFKLLLGGSILWSKTEIEAIYTNSQFKNDIVFTGRLSDADLNDILGAAYALSFAPIFEGFGLPIVEAMQVEVPVICSNVTSMPEVAGDAAILFNPFEVEEIAKAMQMIYSDKQLRNQLIISGKKQKLKFTWENTAALLWESIIKAIN